jgi:hypothetical protein
MRDYVLAVCLIVGAAVLATAHVSIAFGLAVRGERWRAPLALVALPLTPYFAFRSRMFARALVWIASAITYAVARALSYR